MNKKVLIITYYWPPSGGSGVQRWLKMSKFLPEYGWQPVIYTSENGEAPAIDHSLEKDVRPDIEVIKRKIWEPYSIYKMFTGKKKDERMGAGFLNEKDKKSGLTESMAVWIRGNLFIPDARRYWIKPSSRFLINYLKDNPVDAIISTGPPHSMHLIAQKVSKKLNIPWVADFRDPWTKIDFYDQLKLSNYADKKHHSLEKSVIRDADCTVTVSPSWGKDILQMGAKRVEVITNGFDPDDITNGAVKLSDNFTITHIGSMNKDRNPHTLWQVLKEICIENESFKNDLRLRFVGKTDFAVFESVNQNGLENNTEKVAYLPHAEVIKEMQTSQLLLLAINDTPNVAGVIPGKVFEYMATGRPILAVGPPTADAGQIVLKSGAGYVHDFNDHENLKKTILFCYNRFKNDDLNLEQENNIECYSRKSLAGDFAKLLTDLT